MRLIILILSLLLSTLNYGQLFNKLYTYSDPGNDINIASTIATSDGGMIAVGDKMMGGSWIVKFDPQGDTLWCRSLDDINFSLLLSSVAEDVNGNVYVGSSDGTSVKMAKLTPTGSLLWFKDFDFLSYPYSKNKMKLIGDGNGVIAAIGTSSEYFLLTRIDDLGNEVWTRETSIFGLYPGANPNTVIKDIDKNSLGNIVVLGSASSVGTNPHYSFVAEVIPNGLPVWSSSKEYTSGTMTIDAQDIFIGAGDNIFCSGKMTSGTGLTSTFYEKYDNNGNLIWSKLNNDDAYYARIVELSSGEIALSTHFSYLVNDGSPKFGLAKYDATGNYIWGRLFGSTSNSTIGGLREGSNGSIYVVNSERSFTNSVTLMTYNTSANGEAIGCHDIMVTPPTADWLDVVQLGNGDASVKALDLNNASYTFGSMIFTYSVYNLASSGVITEPLCNGEEGEIAYTISGGANPYEFAWSNGTNSQSLVNAEAGIYTVWASDNKGCVKIDTFEITEPSALNATFNVTDVDCFGSQNGAIDVTVVGGTPGYSYLWATQDITEDIFGLGGGFYQLTITDINECEKVLGIAVSEPQQLIAAITSTSNVSCNGACDGALTAIASGGTSPYSYVWNDPSVTVGSSVSNLCPSNYLFTVTDDNGCVSYASAVVTEPQSLMATVETNDSECGAANGGASITLTGGNQPFTYSWSSGGTADTESGLNPGNYTVTYSDANGCFDMENFEILAYTNPVDVCVITVDSNNKNLIVWEKPSFGNINGFYIYRNISGAYSMIGYQPYDSLTQYTDNSFGVDPTITSYRYKISVLDSCGNESVLSDFHETIHLTTNQGVGGEVNLIWDDYEGISFAEYQIIRDSTGNGDWEVIANVPSSNFTYTDLTPPSSPSLRYVVEVVLDSSCTAAKAQDHNSTRSNSSAIFLGGSGTTVEELILDEAELYPNPANSVLNIDVRADAWNYKILDLSGKVVHESLGSLNGVQQIDISSFAYGTYLVRLELKGTIMHKRIVVQ